MKVPSRSFKIGDVTLNKDVVNADSIKNLLQTASDSGVKEGADEVAKIGDQWLKTGSIDSSQYHKIDQFARSSWGHYRQLNGQYWDKRRDGADWKSLKPLEQEIGKTGAFLTASNKLRDQVRVDTARTAVEAAAGSSFSGPVGLVSAYTAWVNGPTWNGAAQKSTEDLLKTYQGYISGDSRMVTEGNQVEQVHRSKLWQAINESLDGAIAKAKAGKPEEIDMQYYELTSADVVGKAAEAARAGNKLRVNVDPGRLSYPDKDASGNQFFDVDEIPDKMRTVIQLGSMKKADIGVSLFPVKKELSDPENLMHRKVLRTGDEVLLSGMNANVGSGENVDAGYVIHGQAAKELTENLKRDIDNSAGSGIEEIWGKDHFDEFKTADLHVTGRGIGAMLDVMAGPSAPGTPLPTWKNAKELDALGKKAGVDVKKLLDLKGESYDKAAGDLAKHRGSFSLSDEGKAKLQQILERGIKVTQEPDNIKRLEDVSLPSGKKVGDTQVDIGDLPPERETLFLNAINDAKKFIYLPGFVVTRAVAAAIVERKNELAAQGKKLDVRIVADPGLYPDGNTPNRYGIKYLEDHGITPRWALLTRSGHHDRKIHAKQMITDQGEISGSTNFSKKGLRDNWEESSYVHFNPDDPKSVADRDTSVAEFKDLWKNQTFELNTKDLAGYWNRYKPAVGREWVVDDSRDGAVKKIINIIQDYEKQSADWIDSFKKDPRVAERYNAGVKNGMADGYALLSAVRTTLGSRNYYEGLNNLKAYKELQQLQNDVADWKASPYHF